MTPKRESKRRTDKNSGRGSTGTLNSISYSDRGNLSEHIIRLYGEETFKLTKSFSTLLIRKNTLLCDLTFLKSCRDQNVIPKAFQLKYHENSRSTKRILQKTGLALIRNSIHNIRRNLDITNKSLYDTFGKLSQHHIHSIIWDNFLRISYSKAEHIRAKKSETQKKKLASLKQTTRRITHNTPHPTLVHNYSDTPIDEHTTKLLSRGFNFAIAPKIIPTETIISQVESSISHLPDNTAEETRQDIATILRHSKPLNLILLQQSDIS